MTSTSNQTAQFGNLAQFIDPRGKKRIHKLTENGRLQTNHGQIFFKEVIGLPWGSEIFSHLKKPFIMLQPSLHEIMLNTKRATTVMYPKDVGFILVNMNISSGQTIIEAGTGSGAFTTALCWAVGPTGHIYSYEVREPFQKLAKNNLEKVGYQDRVTFKNRDIAYGFDETGVDAIFLDVPNPEDYLPMVRDALRPGGYFGSLLPTTNQIVRLLEALEAHDFAFIEVCENLLRYYKPVPGRLRPDDRMVAHTGFLVFARPIIRAEIPPMENKDA
jgi:tRNA (adenine57-N1/adenine58-N1)-methyltransferase catalytic subunit